MYNTDSVINWFNKLKITPKTRFIKIDNTQFYPIITRTTVTNSIKSKSVTDND